MEEIRRIDLQVKEDNLKESLFEIYKILRPNAEKSKTIFKELKGGFMNLSYVLYSENDIQNGIVFRTNGLKFDEQEVLKLNEKLKDKNSKDEPVIEKNKSFFDRSFEATVMNLYSKHNLCKPIYAKYLNGMCFGYSVGLTPSGPLMLTNDYLEEMSSKLAKFHSVKIKKPDELFETYYDKGNEMYGKTMQPLTNLIMNEAENVNEFPYNEFPKLTQLLLELDYLKSKLKDYGFGEIAFCHNDLNQKNIIWNPQERNLKFIDFELAMNNYVECELGQIFFFFAGHFLDDFVEELLPNENYRLKFIKNYLEEKHKLKNENVSKKNFDEEIEKLFIRSNICLLIFMVQATFMTPFFDFKPDIFKIEETTKEKNKLPFFCGRYGLKIWQTYLKVKNSLLKSLD